MRLGGVCVRGAPSAMRRTRILWRAMTSPSASSASFTSAANAHARGVFATLQYQRPPSPGERVGRYITGPSDGGDGSNSLERSSALSDVHAPARVFVADARAFVPQPTLATRGFELRRAPTAARAADLADAPRAKAIFYPEIERLVRLATGCERVVVFDHTLREAGSAAGLNALGDASVAAAPVSRVHCDYTEASGRRRVADMLRDQVKKASPQYSHWEGLERGEEEECGPPNNTTNRSGDDVDELLDGRRVAIVNVWRGVPGAGPVRRSPLAVCDPASTKLSVRGCTRLRITEEETTPPLFDESRPPHLVFWCQSLRTNHGFDIQAIDERSLKVSKRSLNLDPIEGAYVLKLSS